MMLSERSMDAAMLHRFMCSMCCSAGAVSIPCFDDAAKICSEIGNEHQRRQFLYLIPCEGTTSQIMRSQHGHHGR